MAPKAEPSARRANPTRTPQRMKAIAARRGRLLTFAKKVLAAADELDVAEGRTG